MDRRSFLSLVALPPLMKALPSPPRRKRVSLLPSPPRWERVSRYMLPFMAAGLPLFRAAGEALVVPAGGIVRFSATALREFRPDRLMIADTGDFSLLNLSAAGEPMLDEAVPAWMFQPEALGVRLSIGALAAGAEYVMPVRNNGKEARPFSAVLVGCIEETRPEVDSTKELEEFFGDDEEE